MESDEGEKYKGAYVIFRVKVRGSDEEEPRQKEGPERQMDAMKHDLQKRIERAQKTKIRYEKELKWVQARREELDKKKNNDLTECRLKLKKAEVRILNEEITA